ncbi:MAG: sugar ABC transporter permease [Treponema sp.]|jgi:multiple sugar transport system permease protein|nr:sugar ABC transporter permease [Treponema sp.]
MRNKRAALHKKLLPYYFLSPAAILFLLFLAYPILNVFYLSFQSYNPTSFIGNEFVGFGNFIDIFTENRVFLPSFLFSLRWVFTQVTLQLLIGLLIALLINRQFFGRPLVRSIIISPWALSGVIVSILWSLLYNEHFGPVNDVLLKLGFIERPIAWLGNLDTIFPALVMAELWRGIPLFTIAILAALQSIPDDLYEACSIDGGGVFRKFFSITLPYIRDTIILVTLLRTVWTFNAVDLIMNLTDGGPDNMTTTLSLYIARLARGMEFGYASSVAVLSFLFLLIFAVTYLHLSKFGEDRL